MLIPISKIGPVQKLDIEQSTGTIHYDEYGRICTVIKDGTWDNRNDRSPIRMAELFGGQWQDYNDQYVIQVAGCALDCWYCYVDNKKNDVAMTSTRIVSHYHELTQTAPNPVKVLHFMGGMPGAYAPFWSDIRSCMYSDHILFTDVVFVENFVYNIYPWEYMDIPNLMVTGCLKGTNRDSFEKNTGKDWFYNALHELEKYADLPNFYLTLIEYDETDLPTIYSIVPKEKVDLLKVVPYWVTQQRKRPD